MPRAPWASLAALAACLLVLAPAGAAGAAASTASHRGRCLDLKPGSSEAYDWLMSAPGGQPFSDFMEGVRLYKLERLLRSVSRGKALVLPSNHAMQTRFMRLGLYGYRRTIPRHAINAFRQYVASGVAVRKSTIPARFDCSGNVYVAHQFGRTNNRLRCVNPRHYSAAAARVSRGAQVAADPIPPPIIDDAPPLQYSVLGTGYNAYTGLSLSFGMSSLDPGFTMTPIFELNASTVRTLRNLGGACASQFSTSVYNSVSDMSNSLSVGVGITGKFKGGSGKLNVGVNTLKQTTTTSQTITTNSGAKIYLGAWALGSSPANLPLSQGFIQQVRALVNAAAGGYYDPYALQGLVDNYGTHYIKTVYWGGIAAVITQMSSSSLASLKQLNVSVGIAAQVKTVSAQVDVDYKDSSSDKVNSVSNTFSQILIPSNVTLPMSQPNGTDNAGVGGTPVPAFIDCTKWTANLVAAADEQGFKPPVYYTVAPVTELFSYFWNFPPEFRPYLVTAQQQLYTFITECGYSNGTEFFKAAAEGRLTKDYVGCAAETTECVIGTYPTGGGPGKPGGGCNTCFNDGGSAGPTCSSEYAVACNATECVCKTDVVRLYGKYDLNSTVTDFYDNKAYCKPLDQFGYTSLTKFQQDQTSA